MSVPPDLQPLWHVTVLSNFARAFDKYTRLYSKAAIPESSFPDRFYLLRAEELAIGIRKATGLLERLAVPGNRLLAFRTNQPATALHANERSGLGRYVKSPAVRVEEVALVDAEQRLEPIAIEEASARSLQLLHPALEAYGALRPRTFSLLPIARGCQASCPFCFSESSASAEEEQARLDLRHIRAWADFARQRGAARFVLTGGGEPGLVRHELLREIIALGRETLGKVVLITNGHHLARRLDGQLAETLGEYAGAGLGVLAISRHHHADDVSERLMSLRTDVATIARTWSGTRERWPSLRLRLICVLQKGAVEDMAGLEDYVAWGASLGVREFCFKELYVSTSAESVYHRHAANDWSYRHQVPLSLVLEFARRHGLAETDRLPWGAPIFRGDFRGSPVQIAAYTEPSLFWERSHGLARSWNLMSDGRCLVSLEDRASEIALAPAA